MINDQRFNDNSDGVLNKKKKNEKKKTDEAVLPALLQAQCILEGFYCFFLSKMLPCLSCLKHLIVNQSQPACSVWGLRAPETPLRAQKTYVMLKYQVDMYSNNYFI